MNDYYTMGIKSKQWDVLNLYMLYIYNLYINILDTIQVNAKTLCCIKMKLNIQKNVRSKLHLI